MNSRYDAAVRSSTRSPTATPTLGSVGRSGVVNEPYGRVCRPNGWSGATPSQPAARVGDIGPPPGRPRAPGTELSHPSIAGSGYAGSHGQDERVRGGEATSTLSGPDADHSPRRGLPAPAAALSTANAAAFSAVNEPFHALTSRQGTLAVAGRMKRAQCRWHYQVFPPCVRGRNGTVAAP